MNDSHDDGSQCGDEAQEGQVPPPNLLLPTSTVPDERPPRSESLNIIEQAYNDRKARVSVFLYSGIAIVAGVNVVALLYFFCSLAPKFSDIDSVYALYAFLIRGASITLFDICGTYAGVKLIKAAERLTLPTGTGAEQIRALTGETEPKANYLDLIKMLDKLQRKSTED